MKSYDIQILGIKETHLHNTDIEEMTITDCKKSYILFYSGPTDNRHNGIGIVIENELNPQFN